MANYPFPVTRVSLEGDCFGGDEIWQTGFWRGHAGQASEEPTLEVAQQIAAAFSTFVTTANSGVSSNYVFRTVRMSYHLAAGGTNRDLTVIYDLPVPAVGTANAVSQHPAQISMVATLMTALARGRGSKGRMFLPCNQGSISSNGSIASNIQTPIATNLATFLDTVNSGPSGTDSVVNVSPINAANGFAGLIVPVTGVRVGNIYDTQRRRRNDLGETYVQKALTVP